MAERFCTYCGNYRLKDLFRAFRDRLTGPARTMCQPCVDIRKKPRAELEALAKRDSEERKRK